MIKPVHPLKFLAYALFACGLFVALLMTAQSVSARPRGFTGHSGNPAIDGGATCSDCHQGGARPTVVLIGPTEVKVGETVRYTMRISGGAAQTGGLNVSVTDGTLTNGGDDTQIRDDEITQTRPKAFDDDGTVSFTFNWTAPATPQTATMYGAGNSTNGNGETSGDAGATASIMINVIGASADAPSPSPSAPAGNGDCDIPASGPWPPCATGGAAPGNGSCVIPPSGPWPPCATGEDKRPPSTADCVVPSSGPWPVCARSLSLGRLTQFD